MFGMKTKHKTNKECEGTRRTHARNLKVNGSGVVVLGKHTDQNDDIDAADNTRAMWLAEGGRALGIGA